MLVLSRKSGEEIVIGHRVRLVVHRISGDRVALGIVAPRDVPVVRGELRRAAPSEETTARIVPPPAL